MQQVKTMKGQILLLLTSLGLIISIVVTILAGNLIYTSQRSITIKSTEFNLSLVSHVIEKDLINLTALATWCSTNPDLIYYLDNPSPTMQDTLQAYSVLQTEEVNNPSAPYIKRLLIVSTDKQHYPLQVGAGIAHSYPLNNSILSWIDEYLNEEHLYWNRLTTDPYSLSRNDLIIPYVLPIKSADNRVIGHVFMAAHPSVITDKFRGYLSDHDSQMYLDIGTKHYPLIPDSVGNSYTYSILNNASQIISYSEENKTFGQTNSKSVIHYFKQGKTNWVSISYPINRSISVTHMVPSAKFLYVSKLWLVYLGLTVILIFSFSVFVAVILNKNINQPVVKLRRRLDCIGQGDFSIDKSIETNSELGEIGRGINRMSEDITVLLEKRLADEKNKRDLEYRMLQSQINPHFIYNTLASIKWMAVMQNAEGIAGMATALSHLMRSASKDTRTLVPLDYELQLLDDYMLIQNHRYSESICLIKEIDETLLNTQIPRFSLQPIIENAIFHGLEPKGGGTILLKIAADQDDVFISIRDDGVGITREVLDQLLNKQEKPTSMFQELGIQAVNTRIKYAFGEQYGLTIESEESQYTDMTIRLPQTLPQERENTI